ncbi:MULTISPECIES: M15 family metallopeptidase [unclassified Legionella]|uniref:M15 family metallopeptidase n=1 Tax=unclassified Legionella TaxID=2622702 RepID=UPI001E5B4815|nr:M15 family metallopeptidase [Legionella sp. 31fI33]MCC5013609.1 M15 family metallopeptidase [Legionella sp. 31fI33]
MIKKTGEQGSHHNMQRILFLILLSIVAHLAHALPAGFVYLHDVAPDIIEDLRYAGSDNFVGQPIPGYQTARCILTQAAAEQLAKAEKAAVAKGYRFKVYDCYRPQTAVNAFYKWSQNTQDLRTKMAFYPREEKKTLFARGYISLKSGHSRGSTVDLSLVKIGAKQPLEPAKHSRCYSQTTAHMDDDSINTGTRFDCLDVSANLSYQKLSKEQKANRRLLQDLMLSHGFVPYDKEWWHFTLKNEPYPQTYFDFPVH